MKSVTSILFVLCTTVCAYAQQPNTVMDTQVHKMVMQFTAGDSIEQASVTAQVRNIRTVWPNAQIEVVCMGPGLDLLMTSKSKASKMVEEWSAKGVTFAACNNTMLRRKVKKEDLLPAAVIVPSALVELVKKQEEGWAYLKGGH